MGKGGTLCPSFWSIEMLLVLLLPPFELIQNPWEGGASTFHYKAHPNLQYKHKRLIMHYKMEINWILCKSSVPATCTDLTLLPS